MKIGIVGTIWLNTPPANYGGTEGVVYNLTNGLSKKGHEVTFFGPKTAQVQARIIPTVEKPLRDQDISWGNFPYTLYHIATAFDYISQFDILHVHLNKSQDYASLPLASLSKIPVVFTLHFLVPSPSDRIDRYMVLTKYKHLPFISISDSQRDDIPLNFVKTVYNGFDIADYPFCEKPKDYFVWLGKVNPVKGTKEAILAAKKAGVKLVVLGAVDEGMPHMLEYYQKEVHPLIDDKQIIWVGKVDVAKKAKILGEAKAMLNPILWEEPFGLVMTEAQAVGTPVIAFDRGAAPELIIHGKTGFLVDTIDQMVEKIKQVDAIDRKTCRTHVEEKFTVESMIKGYEQAYTEVVANWSSYQNLQNKSASDNM